MSYDFFIGKNEKGALETEILSINESILSFHCT